MHASSDYVIKVSGTDQEIKSIASVIVDRFQDELDVDTEELAAILITEKEFSVEETYAVTFLEDIEEMALAMAQVSADARFQIKGTIDTSESAGKYMDFLIDYAEKKLTTHYSDWYVYPGDYEGMTYEEYCEEYDENCSEEDFRKIQNGWLIAETSHGDVLVEKISLDHIEEHLLE